jgi:beta-glucosidase
MTRRLLTLAFKAAAARREGTRADFEAHDRLARRAAAESIVLLKNETDLLPLDAHAQQKIAVIGAMAVRPRYQGVGSSLVNPTRLSNALEAIQTFVGDGGTVEFSEGYQKDGETNEAMLQEAVNAGANADVAIIFAGLPIEYEMESWDRTHMDIPAGHIKLVREVANAQKNTIVVLSNGSCIAMKPWIESVPAVLEAWLGGQAGGPGIADVLFGSVNPCGKLAVTVPKRLEDSPAYLHFPGENGRHLYGEGIFVGYRYYDTRKIDPLFPFGFGLSYTDFAYSDILVDKEVFSDREQVTVSCNITNTGSKQGKEVIQLYLADHEARLARPEKELKAFEKISLGPGETQKVSFTLTARDFSYYDPALGRWVAESGKFDILIGKSSRDICLRQTVELRSTQTNFVPLTRESYIKDFLNDKAAKEIFADFLVRNKLISPDTPDEVIEGLRNIFVPIAKTLEMFTLGEITTDMLDDLLAQVNEEKAEAKTISVGGKIGSS